MAFLRKPVDLNIDFDDFLLDVDMSLSESTDAWVYIFSDGRLFSSLLHDLLFFIWVVGAGEGGLLKYGFSAITLTVLMGLSFLLDEVDFLLVLVGYLAGFLHLTSLKYSKIGERNAYAQLKFFGCSRPERASTYYC